MPSIHTIIHACSVGTYNRYINVYIYTCVKVFVVCIENVLKYEINAIFGWIYYIMNAFYTHMFVQYIATVWYNTTYTHTKNNTGHKSYLKGFVQLISVNY